MPALREGEPTRTNKCVNPQRTKKLRREIKRKKLEISKLSLTVNQQRRKHVLWAYWIKQLKQIFLIVTLAAILITT